MGALLAFFASPLGAILIKEVPELVGQIVKIAHQKGAVTPDEWLAYIASQKQWDEVPVK
jgi:hypothetical protein